MLVGKNNHSVENNNLVSDLGRTRPKTDFQILNVLSPKSLKYIINLCVKTKKSHCTVLQCPKGNKSFHSK